MGKQKSIKAVKAVHNPYANKKIIRTEKKQKPDPSQVKKSYLHLTPSLIANRSKRLEILFQVQSQKRKLKKKERLKRQADTSKPKLTPITTDDKRQIDENFVFESDEELNKEEELDEFQDYYDEKITPKIFLTTNIRPKKEMFDFLKEIKDLIPNTFYWPRKNFTIKEICEYAPSKGYTHVMVWRETRREIDELILIYLPKGPTAIFKVTNTKLNQEIFHHGNNTDHYPELILNNFNTKVGRRIGRLFASLTQQRPEFEGRRVITFHNQRDFIFMRHHRYIFRDEGERVALQEIGPRLTLKLKKMQLGTFDNVHGEIEFQSKDDMYVSRKKNYI